MNKNKQPRKSSANFGEHISAGRSYEVANGVKTRDVGRVAIREYPEYPIEGETTAQNLDRRFGELAKTHAGLKQMLADAPMAKVIAEARNSQVGSMSMAELHDNEAPQQDFDAFVHQHDNVTPITSAPSLRPVEVTPQQTEIKHPSLGNL